MQDDNTSMSSRYRIEARLKALIIMLYDLTTWNKRTCQLEVLSNARSNGQKNFYAQLSCMTEI